MAGLKLQKSGCSLVQQWVTLLKLDDPEAPHRPVTVLMAAGPLSTGPAKWTMSC